MSVPSATATEAPKKGRSKKSVKPEMSLVDRLDKLFRIPPRTCEAKDGSGRSVIIEHRVGRAAGAFTSAQLMAKLGLDSEWIQSCSRMERRLTDRKEFDDFSDRFYKTQKQKLSTAISGYRNKLEKFYRTQGIKPVFTFVPISDKERGLYIQSFMDIQNQKLVQGDVADHSSSVKEVSDRTYPMAKKHEEMRRAAKQILTIKGVNKDIAARMERIVNGEAPQRLPFLGA